MPVAITHLNPAVDGTAIWFAGGFLGNHPGPTSNAVWRYDTVTDQWSAGPPLPAARGGGGLVRVGRRLHYIGGYFAALEEPSSPDHWALALDGGATWENALRCRCRAGTSGWLHWSTRSTSLGGRSRTTPTRGTPTSSTSTMPGATRGRRSRACRFRAPISSRGPFSSAAGSSSSVGATTSPRRSRRWSWPRSPRTRSPRIRGAKSACCHTVSARPSPRSSAIS